MKLVKPNDNSAEIRVIFAPLKEFPAIAKQYKFRYVRGNYDFFYTFWNGKSEIYRAYVLLATDKLRGNDLRHFALEEITQTLGLSNDSPIFSDSIFFAKRGNGGNARVLSYRDQILIQIFYNHISPGQKSDAVETALKKHWPKTK